MPDWKALVRELLGPLPLTPSRASDIVDELAQHVAQHHADLVADGVDEADAIDRALAPLADRQRVIRDIARADRPRNAAPAPPPAGRGHLAGDLVADARYAARLLGRSPGFAATAILMLALGLGVNTTIFSVVNAVLLRPLPYRDPSRLVMVGELGSNGAGNVGYATFLDWRDRSHGFEEMGLIRSWSATLVSNGEPERVAGMRVSSNFFRLLGVRPALGRDFAAAEDTPARWHVVMLGDGLWRRRFGADPGAVGRAIDLNGVAFTIVGVLPASFEPLLSEHFYQRAEMWSLVGYDSSLSYACRSCEHLKAVGRLKADVSPEAARRDIDAVQAQLRLEHPADYTRSTMTLVPFSEELTGKVKPALAVLMGAVAFVLLIACANVASLLLARMARRERDLALRAALGASRGRIVRQLLVENAILAAAGGAAGLALSWWAVPLLSTIAPVTIARLTLARVDPRVIAFSAVASLGTALVFGLLPSLRAARVDLQATLHGDSRRTSRNPTSAARRLLIGVDVALAVVLLAGAGLMIKSVGRLLEVDPGFNPNSVLSMQISFIGPAYSANETVVAKTDQILAKLRELPGVDQAASASEIPLSGNGDCSAVHIQGRPSPTPADDPCPERYGVTPDYFAVMQIPLRAGRLFSDADTATSEPVLIVGQRTAESLWPHRDAIGQHVRVGDADTGPWRTIIGVVGNVRHQELAAPPTMQMYTPQAQFTDSFLTIVIRGGTDAASLASAARRAIRSVASDVPVYNVAAVDDLVARSVGPRRFVMRLLELFGLIALLMTAVGIYGVIAYSVAERTQEIGIRTALGATRADIVRLVLASGLAIVAVGLVAGVVLAVMSTRYLEASLYGVRATDASTFLTVAAVLFGVAVLAQVVPVVRATRVDPCNALRQE
jgi:putative ABC transport system permease protein